MFAAAVPPVSMMIKVEVLCWGVDPLWPIVPTLTKVQSSKFLWTIIMRPKFESPSLADPSSNRLQLTSLIFVAFRWFEENVHSGPLPNGFSLPISRKICNCLRSMSRELVNEASRLTRRNRAKISKQEAWEKPGPGISVELFFRSEILNRKWNNQTK